MKKRLKKHSVIRAFLPALAAIMALLLVTGVLPATEAQESQSISERIKALEHDIEQKRRELEESEQKLQQMEQERVDTAAQLELSDRQIEQININLQKIRSEEQRLQDDLKAAQGRLDQARAELDVQSARNATRLRSMYKRQRVPALSMVLKAGSVSRMLRGFRMLADVARTDLAVLDDIREKKQTIEKSLNTIQTAYTAQVSLENTKKREQTTLASTREKRRQLLAEIRQDQELLIQRHQQYQDDLDAAQAEKEALLQQIAREIPGLEISDALKQFNFTTRKGRLPWPVEGDVVSSFGLVTDPRTKTLTENRGIEIGTSQGNAVSAVAPGVIMMAQYIRGYGNFICIYHPPNYFTIYGHLADIVANKGMEVREGDIIATAGSSGKIDDDSASLLLEVLNGKTPENPITWLQPASRRSASR